MKPSVCALVGALLATAAPAAAQTTAKAALSTVTAPAAAAPAPRLVVVISVDQLSGDLYDKWRGRFTGGLKRLSEGLVYPSGYQTHAATETCPGHATLLTGKRPNKTGIVANNYRDPATGKQVYCLFDPTKALAHGGTQPPVGPQRLLATTLGDWLKQASPASRVVAVSAKDRGAIAMAGHNPDGVFWIQPGFGFTTYVTPGADVARALAPVRALNAETAEVWRRRPTWTSEHAECRALASDWVLGGKPWRSQLPPTGFGASADEAAIRNDVMGSPIPDALTLQAAQRLIRHYDLGRGRGVDLLAVSFSATDYIGHRYGSQGPEMCDQMHRLDALIGRLLADLDARKVPYLVVLTADHGGSDFTERLNAQGYPGARRIDDKAGLERVNRALMAELGLDVPPLTGTMEDVFVTARTPEAHGRIAAAAARLLTAQPEVAAAFTQEDLLATPILKGKPADEVSVRERLAMSTYPGRSPDLSAALQPYSTRAAAIPGGYVAGHGSVWNYDRRVPILFWWKGAPRQTRFLPVETVDIGPSLAAVLRLTPPADIDGRCLPLADRAPGACVAEAIAAAE